MASYGYVYIMTNRKNGTLYVGVTSDLYRRIHEHKTANSRWFAQKCKLFTLVYFEQYKCITQAIAREKQLKVWRRSKKVALINSLNAAWLDLAEGWYGEEDEW